jgi:hypothetical protein
MFVYVYGMEGANARSLGIIGSELGAVVVEISGVDAPDGRSLVAMPVDARSAPRVRGVSNAVLDAVRDVALVAAGGDVDAARSVSKEAWNAVRAEAGHPDLITAEAFRQKLGLDHWRSVLAVAFLEPRDRGRTLGTYTKRVSALGQGAAIPELRATPADLELIKQFLAEDDLLGGVDASVAVGDAPRLRISTGVSLAGPGVLEAIVVRALRAVAFRLGETPTGFAYDEMLPRMERERARGGLTPLGFPGSETISKRFGSWAKALVAAGLDPPAPHTRPKGLPTVDVLDECIERLGIVPGYDCFRAWCKACDLSVQHRRTDTWDVIVAEAREKRAARGAGTPVEIVRRRRDWPAMPTGEQAADVKAKLGGPRRYLRHRSEEDVREGIRIYAREYLGPNERPAMRRYDALCKRDPRLIWTSKMKGITGKTFTQLCAEEGL